MVFPFCALRLDETIPTSQAVQVFLHGFWQVSWKDQFVGILRATMRFLSY